jgi:DNA-binding response OmpR family regulator
MGMAAAVMRVLAVGKGSANRSAILTRLAERGWAAYPAEGLREAEALLRTFRFEVVLASEFLPDGRGYELMAAARSRKISLFVAVELSETCLWLPAIDRGANVLGKRGVHGRALQPELEMILAGGKKQMARARAASREG